MSTNPPQQTELDSSDDESPEQQFERLVRATINEARLFKNVDKVKLEEEIINLHKALITKQVGEAEERGKLLERAEWNKVFEPLQELHNAMDKLSDSIDENDRAVASLGEVIKSLRRSK